MRAAISPLLVILSPSGDDVDHSSDGNAIVSHLLAHAGVATSGGLNKKASIR